MDNCETVFQDFSTRFCPIELAIVPALELSQKIGVFLQLKKLLSTLKAIIGILILWFPQAKQKTQLLWYFLRPDIVSLISNRSANYERKCRVQICFFLFLHRKQNHCQWRWSVLSFLQLWALVSLSLALLAQSSGKCPVDLKKIGKELTRNKQYLVLSR